MHRLPLACVTLGKMLASRRPGPLSVRRRQGYQPHKGGWLLIEKTHTKTYTHCFRHWLWGPGSPTYLLGLESPSGCRVGGATGMLRGTCPGVPGTMQVLSQPCCPVTITQVSHCPVLGRGRLCGHCSLLPLGPPGGLGTLQVALVSIPAPSSVVLLGHWSRPSYS